MSYPIYQCACGKKWEIENHRAIARDIDSLECDCGIELKTWSGAVFYTQKEVSPDSLVSLVIRQFACPECGQKLVSRYDRKGVESVIQAGECELSHLQRSDGSLQVHKWKRAVTAAELEELRAIKWE